MPVRVRFYGPLKEEFGEEIEFSTEDLSKILLKLGKEIYERFQEGDIMVAVNHKLVQGRVKLKDGDLVALLPRFSGG